MIDRELVTRKVTLILGDLDELRVVASRPRDQYLASIRDELVAERLLERIIGRMIDINYHLLTETGQPPPRDYYESFVQLGTTRVLPIDFARRVAACAGLRNRIVHEYDEVDSRPHAVRGHIGPALPSRPALGWRAGPASLIPAGGP
jgi:uncharacterized protein YutE (UPF0331/DUF86 family)